MAARLVIVVAPDRAAGDRAADDIAREWVGQAHVETIDAPPAAVWPFTCPHPEPRLGAPRAILRVRDLHDAFVNRQTAGTRLVTTQPAYVAAAWVDAAPEGTLVLATANANALREHGPEVLDGRGAFATADVRLVDGRHDEDGGTPLADDASLALLVRAFRATDPAERLALCVRALDGARTPGALVATASACMEVNDLDAAARDLDEALALAPACAAAHFERGKLWLRLDDMERASKRFADAARLMPAFGSAWANLGATLGELDRPHEALQAFERALASDPASPQALNNVGVVSRELGRLAESEAAFRRVVALAPDLAFGYYNLGHTLFLQGRYQVALTAYLDGQKRDPERNPVQASRLAMCRLATGDPAGAIADLKQATSAAPREYRQQLLADTSGIAWALLTHRPDLPGWKQVNDWLSSELARTR